MKNYGKYGYLPKWKSDLGKTEGKVPHTLLIGASGSGKNYNMYAKQEKGVFDGKIKLINMWCINDVQIQEMLTFLFPSKEHLSKFRGSDIKPTSFPVRIYVPVSEYMPKFGYEGLIVPFTVPLDDLPEECIKVLCSHKSHDYAGYLSEYRAFQNSGMTLPYLKLKMLEASGKGVVKERGFNKKLWTSAFKSNYGIQQFLMKRIGILDKEGVVANSNFRFNLDKYIKQEVHSQETIVILYLGAIKSEMVRKFIFTYFFETFKKELGKIGGAKKPFKYIFMHNEIETFSKSTSAKDSTPIDQLMNYYLMLQNSTIRHYGGEIWADCKHPELVDKNIVSMFPNKYLTKIDVKQVRVLSEYFDEIGDNEFKRYLLQTRRNGVFRFIDLGAKLSKWMGKNETIQYGYQLKYPRVCLDGKVDMHPNDFTHLNGVPTWKVLGMEYDNRFSCSEIKDELDVIWKKDDEKLEKHQIRVNEEKNEKKETKKVESFDTLFGRLEKICSLDKLNFERHSKHLTRKAMADYVGLERNGFDVGVRKKLIKLYESNDPRIESFRDWIEEVFY